MKGEELAVIWMLIAFQLFLSFPIKTYKHDSY
uniref:Uncharacterized protein n=1 Tax=Shewanella putrefaciens (strain 200) TaxID=399804 RepID=E6XHX6_SHEP2